MLPKERAEGEGFPLLFYHAWKMGEERKILPGSFLESVFLGNMGGGGGWGEEASAFVSVFPFTVNITHFVCCALNLRYIL